MMHVYLEAQIMKEILEADSAFEVVILETELNGSEVKNWGHFLRYNHIY